MVRRPGRAAAVFASSGALSALGLFSASRRPSHRRGASGSAAELAGCGRRRPACRARQRAPSFTARAGPCVLAASDGADIAGRVAVVAGRQLSPSRSARPRLGASGSALELLEGEAAPAWPWQKLPGLAKPIRVSAPGRRLACCAWASASRGRWLQRLDLGAEPLCLVLVAPSGDFVRQASRVSMSRSICRAGVQRAHRCSMSSRLRRTVTTSGSGRWRRAPAPAFRATAPGLSPRAGS